MMEHTKCRTVITAGERFQHVMALNTPEGDTGVVRGIESRQGTVDTAGFIDRSALYLVAMDGHENAEVVEPLHIEGQEAVVAELTDDCDDFLGLEDPDLVVADDGRVHLYCTIAIRKPEGYAEIHLGHAEGDSVRSLEMTDPVLGPSVGMEGGAKELAFAPETSGGTHQHLVESDDNRGGTSYSVIRRVEADAPGGEWDFDGIVFHPDDDGKEWCSGHASPGPFFPRTFVDVGEDRRVGLFNGRGENREVDGETQFSPFKVGLMVYNYESGEIEWVSDDPLIDDAEAENVTFASDYALTGDSGVIYAHVDDDRVKAYPFDRDSLKAVLPDRYT